jgi:hypothetical protein
MYSLNIFQHVALFNILYGARLWSFFFWNCRCITASTCSLSGLALAPGSNFKFSLCCFGTGIGTPGLCRKAIRELRVRALLQLNK